MRYMKYDLFPTQVIRFDAADALEPGDVDAMKRDVDAMIEDGRMMQVNDLTPKHQSKPVLFSEGCPPHWARLRSSFMAACSMYIDTVDDAVKNQDKVQPTGCRAWFYKGWGSLNRVETNPWHDHSPSFISGVFYLDVPGDGKSGGTVFADPRRNEGRGTRQQEVPPMPLTWVLFPGWLTHRSSNLDTEQPRYVIAADCYVRVP